MTIKQRQALLAYYGCYSGAIDGQWGPASRQATEAFQRVVGLPADGVCGAQTDAALISNVGKSIQMHPPDSKDSNVPATGGDIWQESKYFGREEFRCPCGKCGGFPVEPDAKLVRLANEVREELGVPMIIVPPDGHSGGSGVRCKAYNDTLSGSSKTSTHLEGKACDFRAVGVSPSVVEAVLTRRKASGQIAFWYRIAGGNSFHMNV